MRARNAETGIAIAAPVLAGDDARGWRVGARVGTDEVEFASDEPLAAGADAFVTAFLLPAAMRGATLTVDAELDERLAGSLGAINDVARRYWGFPGAALAARGRIRRETRGRPALFFTGGVDSFFALRRLTEPVDRLIFVDGFDLGLADRGEFARARAAIEAVAAATGMRASFPRTNLRRDPTFAALGWDRSFGAALASVAHAMAPVVSEIHVPSSAMTEAYGSTPELDSLWSSGAVAVVHRDVEWWRIAKAKAIADWPLAHKHLRVCFAPRRHGRLNCGVCEKCVRTLVCFSVAGAHDRFETFPRAALRELIDGVRLVPPVNRETWEHIRPQVADRQIAAAIDRLLERRPTAIDRLRAAAGPWLDRVPGGGTVKRLGRRLLRG